VNEKPQAPVRAPRADRRNSSPRPDNTPATIAQLDDDALAAEAARLCDEVDAIEREMRRRRSSLARAANRLRSRRREVRDATAMIEFGRKW